MSPYFHSRLGSGGFGKVYKIRHKATGKKYAAKYQKLTSKKIKDLVHQEAYFLKKLSEGKRIVDYYNYYEKDKHSLMVLELLEGGELFSVVGATNYTLTEGKCANFTYDILKAVNWIHEHQVELATAPSLLPGDPPGPEATKQHDAPQECQGRR